MNIKSIGLGVIVLMLSFATFAQEVEVKGIVKDNANLEIPFASIVFKSVADEEVFFGVLGDEEGKFVIQVPVDTYTVEISVVGITPKRIPLVLEVGTAQFDMGVIILQNEVALDEIVVRSNKNAFKANLDKKVYNVAQDITNRGGTLTDIMQNLPSVQIEAEGGISIRGDQNVTILIDGRPSGLATTADLFSTIPASSVEKVEVITNPSSKYTAQGTAGIVNIILKKGQKERFSSSIEIFAGERPNYGINANITKGQEKGSWYINTGVGYSEPKAINDFFLSTPNDTPDTSIQESERIRGQKYFLLNVGGTKQFNEKNNLVGSITFRTADSDNSNNTFYQDFDAGQLFLSSNRLEDEDEKNNFVQANVGYDLNFNDEHKISFGANLELIMDDESAIIDSNETFPLNQMLEEDRTSNNEDVSRYSLTTDYTLPLKRKRTLDFGYRGDFTEVENDFAVQRIIGNNPPISVDRFTDQTVYDEKIHAFYGQLSKSFEKFSYKLGLRTEITDITISSNRDNLSINKNYTDLFPSSFFNYKINEDDEVQLSLSRRISRPFSEMVVPFAAFTDERNVFVGNPDLDPSYIVAAELGYSNKINEKLNFTPTIYYRKTFDEIEFFVEQETIIIGNESSEILTSTLVNIGDYTTYGAEIGISYEPFNWWNMYGEIVLNGFKQRGEFRDANFDGDGVLVSGTYNTNFNLLKSLKLQVQNYYRGPIETGQYKREGFYGMNAGVSNEFLDGNLTVTLNVSDVFNSNLRKVTTFGTDFTRDLVLQYRVRQINLSLNYKFNKNPDKGKKGSQFDNYEIIN